jgi:Protein kinase domain
MTSMLESVRMQCPEADSKLVEMHFRRMPGSYLEGYSVSEIAGHIRMLALLKADRSVEVGIQPQEAQSYEVVVVGEDRTGVLACITTALATDGLSLRDVKLATYRADEEYAGKPTYFVDVLRVVGDLRGRSLQDVASSLRGRLANAFRYLAEGKLAEAQIVVSSLGLPSQETQLPPEDAAQTASPAEEEAHSSLDNEFQIGHVLDERFQITQLISRSGMSTVYKATDLSTGKPVALKVPFMQLESDPTLFSRFEREESIGKVLNHPNILRVVPVERKSRPYLAMEYLEGQTLRQLLSSVGKLPVPDALRIASRVCEALDHMHRHDMVHRDLKPENLMLCKDGSLRIMDFGIVKVSDMRRLTFGGFSPSMGTPDYMAPEQVKGKRGDQRTDIYSLGAVLFEMTTGTVPFEGATPFVIMNARLIGGPPAPRAINPDIPPEVEEIVLHAMEREPDQRYPSAAAMKAELDAPEKVKATGRDERLKAPAEEGQPQDRTLVLSVLIPLIAVGLFFLLVYWFRHR